MCAADTISSTSAATSCIACGDGEKAEEGSAKCSKCDAGEAGTGAGGTCEPCAKGKYSTIQSLKATPASCTLCAVGRAQELSGQASCLPCIPGQYNDQLGLSACKNCALNTFTNSAEKQSCTNCDTGNTSPVGSASCSPCAAGTAGATCDECIQGKFRSASDNQAAICKLCPRGYYVNETSQASCLPCAPGFFSDNQAAAICKLCRQGYFQAKSRGKSCNIVPPGKIVGSDRSVVVEISMGFHATLCDQNTGACVSSGPCSEGSVGTNPPSANCLNCSAGTSSFKGSMTCSPCPFGKFNNKRGGLCNECSKGRYQPQEQIPSTNCLTCPFGFSQNISGQAFCADNQELKPEDCKSTEYYDDKQDSQAAQCIQCPVGGSCEGPIRDDGIVARFGFWQRNKSIPAQERFVKCLLSSACLGSANPSLANTYFSKDAIDLAMLDLNHSVCNEAEHFRKESPLCHSCSFGSRRFGRVKCLPCPNSGWNLTLIILGSLGAVVILIFFIASSVSSAEQLAILGRQKQHLSDPIQKIIVNYFQVSSLFGGFTLKWPDSVLTLFDVQVSHLYIYFQYFSIVSNLLFQFFEGYCFNTRRAFSKCRLL